jgi:hypothetical protein
MKKKKKTSKVQTSIILEFKSEEDRLKLYKLAETLNLTLEDFVAFSVETAINILQGRIKETKDETTSNVP